MTRQPCVKDIDPARSHAVLRNPQYKSLQLNCTFFWPHLIGLSGIFYSLTMAAQLPLDVAGVLAIWFEVRAVVRITEVVH